MTAKELISNLILPLVPEDKMEQVLTIMSIYHLKDLPIVSQNKLMGLISEDTAASSAPELQLKDTRIIKTQATVRPDDHVFEVLNRMSENNITIVPVVDDDDTYLGVIRQDDLIHFFAKSFSFNETGGIIVLETSRRGYSLSEVCRVIELENVSVIASFINEIKNSEVVLLTLKLNKNDISDVITALERYDYKIHASFTEKDFEDNLKDRYDQLMNYLNV